MSGSKTEKYDVIVVGGGMVGATFACSLPNTLNVAVVESCAAPVWKNDSFDMRVSAITRASENFLKNIGLWESISKKRICPFSEMHVWDATGNGVIHFDCAHIGEANMGHIIENSVIQLSALEQLRQYDNIDYINPAEAESMDVKEKHALLTLTDGRVLQADLIVGADGSQSWVRKQAGIEVKGWSYHQKAVVSTVKTSKHHQQTAWQRFMPTGPLAFLPLADGYSSIVWSATNARADELLALTDNDFSSQLEDAFESKLGAIESVTPRAAFPLKLQHAEKYVAQRIVLIGDAAHTIHPLAGQGVNLGFMDAATLAEVLANAVNKNKSYQFDLGEYTLLRRYERWRKTDNLRMLASMDAFKKVFGNKVPLLRWARNTGLSMTDKIEPLKNLIMRHTMGLDGDLPELATKKLLRHTLDIPVARHGRNNQIGMQK